MLHSMLRITSNESVREEAWRTMNESINICASLYEEKTGRAHHGSQRASAAAAFTERAQLTMTMAKLADAERAANDAKRSLKGMRLYSSLRFLSHLY